MNASFQFQMPDSVGQFVTNRLGLLLLLFVIGFLVAALFLIRQRIVSLNRLWRTLTIMFKASAEGE